jgi:hypothetical protein
VTDEYLEADLAAAFLRPAGPVRPELAEAIMARVRRADRRRRAVILASGLVGAGIAAAAVGAAGLLDPQSFGEIVGWAQQETTAVVLGLALIALATARHALRDV